MLKRPMHRRLLYRFISLTIFSFFCWTLPLNASSTQDVNAISPQRLIFASSEYLPHYGTDLPKQGAMVEIIRRAFALQDVQIEIAFMPFARALHDTQQGQYAGLIAVWHTPERAAHFLYSEPIYANEIVLFKRANTFNHISDIAELLRSEGTLGLVTGYAQHPKLLQSNLEKVSVATDAQVFQMLVRERVDVVPADLQNGLYLIAKLPAELSSTSLDWLLPAIELKPMHLAFPKSRPESAQLHQQFNVGLRALQQSGELEQILAELLPHPAAHAP
ncbi:substrate-binding periplasmic protein [Alishewanella tabrizica]|uniref:Solute-binding protein family 3/N-terminal domain-containing protein n=1 Tax=Alishewanella tabrizica TaxID=671278 RepID=A0ABQ2WRQ2_9ALTE|nr:transporter substrate-binding domain-containing protein [Alishewanella tabrizica]GGW70243.1 hypothetical protein GCM10008111_27990 [Alishewanella tabrizica]